MFNSNIGSTYIYLKYKYTVSFNIVMKSLFHNVRVFPLNVGCFSANWNHCTKVPISVLIKRLDGLTSDFGKSLDI